MNNFCTLFDSKYLTRGLAMYQSLIDCGSDFHMYIYAFDDLYHDILIRLGLPRMSVVSLAEFENEALLAVKPTRTPGEYCWTCASHTISHSLETYKLDEVTYIDADLYFYHDPELLLQEFRESGKSVLLTEHRYTPEYDQSEPNGIYCVQFITFRNNTDGLEPLRWWQDRCLEWCFNREEEGRFGDQKYLDDWPQRFQSVHVLQHLGGGVAPWNVQQYQITERSGELFVDGFPLVFYHFHGYQKYDDGTHELSLYRLTRAEVVLLYRPYVRSLEKAEKLACKVWPGFYTPTRPRAGKITSPLWELSVITPVFNGIRFIEFCIQNIIEQNCPDAEHIIVDGGSTDGTLEVIKRYADEYPHIRWVSEMDHGLWAAMNKGIRMAGGAIIGILKVDDYYEPDVLCTIIDMSGNLLEPTLLVGNYNIGDGNKKFGGVFPMNPSAYFYHKSLHELTGLYDVDGHYGMDLHFIFKAVQKAHLRYVDKTWGNHHYLKGAEAYNDKKNFRKQPPLHIKVFLLLHYIYSRIMGFAHRVVSALRNQ